MSTEERIKELEEELSRTPYNKATVKHIGLLKARIARLKERSEKKKGGGGPAKGFSVKKAGDATVLLIGFPSVGKSTLINKLTNADSKVSDYKFTTVDVIPGMLDYKGVHIQVLDVPGIIQGASKGKGKGRQILSMIGNADLLLVLLDNPRQLEETVRELSAAGVRLNQKPPNVKLSPKEQGGLSISFSFGVDNETREYFKKLIQEYGIYNADVIIRERIEPGELIDVLSGNRKYLPTITAMNKSDLVSRRDARGVDLFISAKNGQGLERLKELIFERLQLARVYMKKIGDKPDMEEPLVLKGDRRVEELCARLHKDFLKKFDYARVWGPSAKFDGQRVGLEHEMRDGDIVELHLKR